MDPKRTERMTTPSDAHAFVGEVLAGRAPLALPPDREVRDQIVSLLRLHRLLGMWYVESGCAEGGTPRLPENESMELRARHAQRVLINELTLEAADRAREALAAVDVPALLFKGTALLRGGVYLASGARALGDADLLIPDRNVPRAIRALESAGFRPWVSWDDTRVSWLPAFTFADARAPEGLEITLDLHWRIPYGSYRSGADPERDGGRDCAGLWDGADRARGLPSPEPHFLLLIDHFVRHLRVTPHIVGIGDLVRMSAGNLDPERLLSLARERRGLGVLRALLGFLRGDLGVQLPQHLVDVLSVPAKIGGLRGRVLGLDRLLAAPGNRKEGRLSGLLVQSLAFGSPRRFLAEVADVLFPPRGWLEYRYGAARGSRLSRWFTHLMAVVGWLAGRGVSPLSPNQEFEDPRR
jgi:Uncharacterised nucleotidyltransferase